MLQVLLGFVLMVLPNIPAPVVFNVRGPLKMILPHMVGTESKSRLELLLLARFRVFSPFTLVG